MESQDNIQTLIQEADFDDIANNYASSLLVSTIYLEKNTYLLVHLACTLLIISLVISINTF